MLRKSKKIFLENIENFKKNLLYWANKNFEKLSYYESNDFKDLMTEFSFDSLIAVGSAENLKIKEKDNFKELKEFYETKKDWLFGFLTYDLKNEIEDLKSDNLDNILMPKLDFFVPIYVFIFKNNNLEIRFLKDLVNEKFLDEKIKTFKKNFFSSKNDIFLKKEIKKRFTKLEYLKTLENIKYHISIGDIYEANFCQEFYIEDVKISPLDLFFKLQKTSPTPFSCFYKLNEQFLLSASPERFIKKVNNKIISQPIKGTIKRGKTKKEDDFLKEKLYHDEKEMAENIMIVDLVRNDLSRTAKKGSVKVDELCKIYSFEQVHQMISTISSFLSEDKHFIDAIKFAFPMGSMTGAPKIKAMELMEKFEKTKRGLYSGAVGYISPCGNFDFNVIIRSILYNNISKYLSFIVGGAITNQSIPEKEYDECLLKAKAILKILK